MELSKLKTLEEKVESLIAKSNDLTNSNNSLQEELTKIALDLEAAESLINSLQEEKQAILDKIDQLLVRLD